MTSFSLVLTLAVLLQTSIWGYYRANHPSFALRATVDEPPTIKQTIDPTNSKQCLPHVLTLSFPALSQYLGGSGRAKMFWEHLRQGHNPIERASILPPAELLPSRNPVIPGLSDRVKSNIESLLDGKPLLSAQIIKESLSSCGTNKLLLALNDGYTVESVIIPSYKVDRTTLCVSTQIGCDRGCAFCLTGTMGLLRNLTSEEIISQVIHGNVVALRDNMPKLTNVVFMGMGDAGRNMAAVGEAVDCLTDRDRMSMAQAKICISTVGPSPEAFMVLAGMRGSLAWSLHSADDRIRRQLVPSTRHTTVELREGLMRALASRDSLRTRSVMIALTLIQGVNDSPEDARKVAEFLKPMREVSPKIAVDLIPYNDNSLHGFRTPDADAVKKFQDVLHDHGFFVAVRATRGDEESAACGMLATDRKNKSNHKNNRVDDSNGSSSRSIGISGSGSSSSGSSSDSSGSRSNISSGVSASGSDDSNGDSGS